jgi:5'-AMP-activated protein kinase regulatory gamma subunit
MHKTLRDLKIGTYDNIETSTEDTSIITALAKFVERVSAALCQALKSFPLNDFSLFLV